MALGSVGIRKAAAAGIVPVAVLGQIGDDELRDRYAYARQLTEQANRTGGREGAALIQKARAVMVAQPRAATERAVRETVAKASALGNTGQADALRRKANELLEQHPPAPRRGASAAASRLIAKASTKASGSDSEPKMVAVFDASGNLVGVVDPADLTPVQSAPAQAANEATPVAKPSEPAPGQPGAQDEVAKVAKRKAAQRRNVPYRPAATVVLDDAQNMIGVVRNNRFTPVPAQVQQVAKARADDEAARDLAGVLADPRFGRAALTALPDERKRVVAAWKASRRPATSPGRR
jgi:hypothetical protein